MDTILLFDIDGTLLNTGGAGQRAMEMALGSAFGVEVRNEEIPAAGRTDYAITTDLFSRHRIADDPEARGRFTETYLEYLSVTLKSLSGRVLPGVEGLLNSLSTFTHVKMGLLTGNFEQGARLKLSHYSLDHHFLFGGYGDFHSDRDDVAKAAILAAIEHLQSDFSADQVWVIGDTPSDVKCGRAIGARVLAVSTGMFSADELAACAPDVLVENFSDLQDMLNRLEVIEARHSRQ